MASSSGRGIPQQRGLGGEESGGGGAGDGGDGGGGAGGGARCGLFEVPGGSEVRQGKPFHFLATESTKMGHKFVNLRGPKNFHHLRVHFVHQFKAN